MRLFKSLLRKPLVGLDIGVSGIKAVELTHTTTPRLAAYNRIPLPIGSINENGEVEKRDVVVSALKRLFDSGSFSTRKVAVGASGASITIKKITVPRMSAQDLEHQLYWEAEQYIPFDISEVNLDFAILGNSSVAQASTPMMDVLLVAAKKEFVGRLMGMLQEAGLQVEVVDSQAFALGNAFEFNYGYASDSSATNSAYMILDFGAGSTKLSIVEDDKTTFSRELNQSGNACTRLISDRLGTDFASAEKLKLSEAESPPVALCVREFLSSLTDEISRTLAFYLGQASERAVQGIYICGGGSLLGGMDETLETALSIPVHWLNPVQNVAGSGQKLSQAALSELASLGGVAVGLALRKTGDTK